MITGIRWLNDRESGKFKGCGFIDFADTESVDEFVSAFFPPRLASRCCPPRTALPTRSLQPGSQQPWQPDGRLCGVVDAATLARALCRR